MMTAPAQTRMEFIRFRRISSTRKTCGSRTGFPHAGLLHGAPRMGLLAQVQSKMLENVKIAQVRQHFGHPRTVSHRTECIPAPGSRTGFLPPALKYPKRSHSEPRINKKHFSNDPVDAMDYKCQANVPQILHTPNTKETCLPNQARTAPPDHDRNKKLGMTQRTYMQSSPRM